MRLDLTTKELNRFWSRVDRSGGPDACWIWLRGKSCGYGTISFRGKDYLAHRVSYMLEHGEVPEGLGVLHNCPEGDNPACVNPRHLWAGTQSENVYDMLRKGRQRNNPITGDAHFSRRHPERILRGSDIGNAKLCAEQVREIRRRRAGGEKLEDLAQEFRVTFSNICAIAKRRTWKHLD